MAQLYTQTVPRHAGWILTGPAAATALAAQQDITVSFTDGSSVVVPAFTAAVLSGGGTTWDRSQMVVVGYVLKGDGTLRACPEGQLATISTDYAPLVRVLHDAVQVYQPQQPGGAAIKSGAWSGGASVGVGRAITGGGHYGVFASQSIHGGGSVSGVPFSFGANNGTYSYGGFYLKIAAAPGATTTLWDINFGTPGYVRFKINTAREILLEAAVNGGARSVSVTPSNPVPTGEWCWLGFSTRYDNYNGIGTWAGFDDRWVGGVDAQLVVPGGTAPDGLAICYGDWDVYTPSSSAWTTTYSGAMGWGVATSDGTAGASGANLAMSKLVLSTYTGNPGPGPYGAPSSDPGSANTALYLCRQPTGAVSGTLTDSSGNGYNLTPGGAGCTIVADGPYV